MLSQKTPATTWARRSNPDRPPLVRGPWAMLLVLATVLLAPAGMLALLISWLCFQWGRVNPRSLFGSALLWWVSVWIWSNGTLFTGWWPGLVELASGVNLPAAGGLENLAGRWWVWVVETAPMTFGVGLLAGCAAVAWRWSRRPAWEDLVLRRTLRQVMRRRRVIRQIARDLNGPDNGLTIGVDRVGNRVVQTDQEAATHTLITGQTGSGKTSAALIRYRDALRRGHSWIGVDMKASPAVAEQMAEWADRYDRRFRHFVLDPVAYTGPAGRASFYDPAGHGDYSRRKDLLMGAWLWDAEYYKTEVAAYLQLCFKVDELSGGAQAATFDRISHLLVPANLQQLLRDNEEMWPDTPEGRADREAAMETVTRMPESARSAVKSMHNRVQIVRQSITGAALRRGPDGFNIDLLEACRDGDVVLFSLDALMHDSLAPLIGRLVIQDMKTLAALLLRTPAERRVHCFVDEFSELDGDNVLGLLNKCREAGISVTISTQGLADLAADSAALMGQISNSVTCDLVLRTKSPTDAEFYGGLSGTATRYQRHMGIEMTSSLVSRVGVGAGTGSGALREIDAPRLPPGRFQDLPPMTCHLMVTNPQRIVEDVTIVREESRPPRTRGPN